MLRLTYLLPLVLLAISPSAYAFGQCPNGMLACATPGQLIVYVVIPTVLCLALAGVARRRIRTPFPRYAALATIGSCWCIGMFGVSFALTAALAPCSYACWY